MPETVQQVVVSFAEPAEHRPFTPQAVEHLRTALGWYESSVLNIASAVASSVDAECVLKDHVAIAEKIVCDARMNGIAMHGAGLSATPARTPRGALVRHLGTIGGAVFSLALSMLSNILSGTPATPARVLLTVVAAVVGTLAITIHAIGGPSLAKSSRTLPAPSNLANPAASESATSE